MTWCAVALGLGMDAVIHAAHQLGLEEVPVGVQPSEVEQPIQKELALAAKYRSQIPGGSGRLLLIRVDNQIFGLWDQDNDKGGIPGHIGKNGDKLAQATAVLTSDRIFKLEEWTKTSSEVTREGTIISSYKDKQ